MQHLDEQELVRRAQGGERAAFSALVDRYWPRVFRWLCGMCHRTHTAEDLTQDVFLRAWSALGSFQAGTSFRAWIFRIASNGFIDSTRGPRGTPPAALPDTLPARDAGPVTTVLAQECETLVQQACDRLPLGYRAALLLRTQEDLSFAEIATALGVTEETARWRLFKARQLLLRELGPYLDNPEP